jgi:hypothetical protein
MNTQIRSHRAGQAVAALLGVGTLAVFAGCANSGAAPKTTPVHAAQPAAPTGGPVTNDAQAMWAVLTSLPSHDVDLIVPGLTLRVRQDLTAIAAAAVADHSPAVSSASVAAFTVPPSFDSQAIFGVLTTLPSADVAVIAPGLDAKLRDDLNAIARAVAGSVQH